MVPRLWWVKYGPEKRGAVNSGLLEKTRLLHAKHCWEDRRWLDMMGDWWGEIVHKVGLNRYLNGSFGLDACISWGKSQQAPLYWVFEHRCGQICFCVRYVDTLIRGWTERQHETVRFQTRGTTSTDQIKISWAAQFNLNFKTKNEVISWFFFTFSSAQKLNILFYIKSMWMKLGWATEDWKSCVHKQLIGTFHR